MQGKVPINLSDTNASAIVWSPWLHNSTVEKSLESTGPIFKFFDSPIWVIHVHESELIVSRSCLAYLCKTKLPSYELYMYSFFNSQYYVLLLCNTKQNFHVCNFSFCSRNGRNRTHIFIGILALSLGMYQLYRILTVSHVNFFPYFNLCIYFKSYIHRILIFWFF